MIEALAFPASAASDTATEATVKAAFVYNFAKFVEWRTDASNSVKICLAGVENELAVTMAGLEGKTVQTRAVSVQRDIKATELDACHILVVGPGGRPMAEAARGRAGLLTVSDVKGFAASGGIIELFVEEGRMRFEINTRAAQRAGLRISSQLLKLAKFTPDS
ncbi:MAG: YfiR family protein [Betaproteobacteria bacterium]